jgi:hypothetical protein
MAAAPGVDSVVAADSRDNITALTSGSGAAHRNGDSREKIPWFRKWLGDRYYLGLSIDKSASDDEIARYKKAFPEGVVSIERAIMRQWLRCFEYSWREFGFVTQGNLSRRLGMFPPRARLGG